jgi:hypothetical protein
MKEKIIKILEEYEYDVMNWDVMRNQYDGEIDNLWNEIAEKICQIN